jgi:hypothetical protein
MPASFAGRASRRREACRARLDDRARGLVPVKHHRAERGQPLGDGALPRSDAARQAETRSMPLVS